MEVARERGQNMRISHLRLAAVLIGLVALCACVNRQLIQRTNLLKRTDSPAGGGYTAIVVPLDEVLVREQIAIRVRRDPQSVTQEQIDSETRKYVVEQTCFTFAVVAPDKDSVVPQNFTARVQVPGTSDDPVTFDLAEGRFHVRYTPPSDPSYAERQRALKTDAFAPTGTSGYWSGSWMGCSKPIDLKQPVALVLTHVSKNMTSTLRWN